MKKNLFIILALLVSSFAYGQPGYQGHCFLILYNSSVSPTLLNYNANGGRGLTSFNLKHQLNLEYAIRRKFNLGIHGGYNKLSLDVTLFDADDRPVKSNYYSFGIYGKKFLSDAANLAPRGSYFQFGLGAHYVMISDELSGKDLHSYIGHPTVQCGFGKQTILYKRLMLDYGINFSLNTSVFNIFTGVFTYGETFSGTGSLEYVEMEKDKLQKMAGWSSLGANLVAVKIGIGILP